MSRPFFPLIEAVFIYFYEKNEIWRNKIRFVSDHTEGADLLPLPHPHCGPCHLRHDTAAASELTCEKMRTDTHARGSTSHITKD